MPFIIDDLLFLAAALTLPAGVVVAKKLGDDAQSPSLAPQPPAYPTTYAAANPAPAVYGQPGIYETAARPEDHPIPGFRQMYLMPDGSVCAPTVNPPHTNIEFHCRGEWFHGMMDTGATLCALSHADARRMGFNLRRLSYDDEVRTSNGLTTVAKVKIPEMAIGPIRTYDVPAYILRDNPRESSLIGQSFLRRLSSFRQFEEGVLLYP